MNIAQDKYVKITWGACGVSLATIITVVLWLASVDSKATDALNRVERQKDAIKEMRTSVTDIDKRTIRIETIVTELKEKWTN